MNNAMSTSHVAPPAGLRPVQGRPANAVSVSLRSLLPVVTDPEHLDQSVDEVFQMMLGLQGARLAEAPPASGCATLTAVVGLGGLLSGACVFQCDEEVAKYLTGQMTEMDVHDLDDMVQDAIGEICNMVAGAWKAKVAGLASNCSLSLPVIVTGCDYNIHVQAPEFELRHVYAYQDKRFSITIICDSVQ